MSISDDLRLVHCRAKNKNLATKITKAELRITRLESLLKAIVDADELLTKSFSTAGMDFAEYSDSMHKAIDAAADYLEGNEDG